MAINLEKLNDKILSYNAKLLPVVKNRSNNEIKFIYDSNFRDFGENRLDDFYEHSKVFKDVKYHFIAPIQSRKLKEICNSFTYVHTITRNKEIKLLESFDYKGEFFIQMNLDNDPNKSGIDENSLNNIIENCFESNLSPCGLMTIPNRVRPCIRFSVARALRSPRVLQESPTRGFACIHASRRHPER